MSKIFLGLLIFFPFLIFSDTDNMNKNFMVEINKESDKLKSEKNKTIDLKKSFIIEFDLKDANLNLQSEEVIKGAAEVIITKSGYYLLDEFSQEKVLKLTNICIDKNKISKKTASNILTIKTIRENKKLKITAVVIDVETTAKIATDFIWYKGDLNNSEQFDKDMRDFFSKVFEILPKQKKNEQNNLLSSNDLTEGDNQAVTIVRKTNERPKEGKYRVLIKSNPTNAEIYDDITGKYWGKTPFEAEMREGTYTVNVEGLKDFDKAKRTFTVNGNIEFTLNMRTLKHKIGFIINQPNSKIYIDNEYIGETSYKANDIYYASVKEGERKIKIVKEKYKTIEEKININSQQDFKFAMKENFSVLTIRSNPQGAIIYLDGNQQDQTPLKLKLENNKNYTIKLIYSDYKDYTEIININEDNNKDIFLDKIEK